MDVVGNLPRRALREPGNDANGRHRPRPTSIESDPACPMEASDPPQMGLHSAPFRTKHGV